MYVRIARFEGGSGDWDDRIQAIGDTIRNRGKGTPLEPAGDAIRRAMLLVDREGNRGANIVFCDSEEDLRRVDEALNAVVPVGGRGPRTSVEMYEVAVDETPNAG